MQESYPFDPALYDDDSPAGGGTCTFHDGDDGSGSKCTGDPVVSYQDRDGRWQAGCSAALEELVEREEITPLGQGA